MRVIFLDIDGVLNDNRKCDNGHCAIDLRCVRRLNQVLQGNPDLHLVVSSDWREWVHADDLRLAGLEKLLLTHGIDCEGRVVGVTRPDRGTPGFPPECEHDFHYRTLQIREWVRLHHPDDFLVLDDRPLPDLGEHFVRTDGSRGLTDDDVARIDKILSRQRAKAPATRT